MHFSSPIFIITTLLVTLVSSHQSTGAAPTGPDLTKLPGCAAACAVNAFASTTGCKTDDYPCLCRDQKFTNTIDVCIRKSCSGEDLEKAVTFAKGVCGSAVTTGASVNGTSESRNATFTTSAGSRSGTITTTIGKSTTASSGTATTTSAKSSSSAGGTPNSGGGFRPSGFAFGAWLLALFAL